MHGLSLSLREAMGAAFSKRLTVDNIKKDDIIIAVIGRTGAGKSTFINKAAGENILPVGHSLKPSVSDVQHIECSNPERYGERRVVFVDTPAFDSERDEKAIEKKLKTWLKSVSSKTLRISGILYLQQITDIRLSDPPLRHLTLLRDLCEGSIGGFPNRVVLVTTMWRPEPQAVELRRERELQEYWNKFPRGSVVSRIMRFENSFDSAWSIVFALMENSGPGISRN